MAIKKAGKKVKEGILDVLNHKVPFEIWEENRPSVRFGLSHRKAIVRLPRSLNKAAKQDQLQRFTKWIEQTVTKRPDLLHSRKSNEYQSGQTWNLGNYSCTLNILVENRKTVGFSSFQNTLSIKLPEHLTEVERFKSIEKCMYRWLAKVAYPDVERLIDALNDNYFQVDIGRIKLSPTKSRWGSCSHKGNINLSSLLLAAPDYCLKAVVIHELAHRIEMNHSDRFWKIVYEVMPTYGEAHKWLKANGASLGWTNT